ncbi:MAG: amino acid ABC transporter permease [Pseudomonadota bacterium]|nr:amino acid ABC transporter permease [Pseudomonadota bacterium]
MNKPLTKNKAYLWVKTNLFSTPFNSALTLILALLLAKILWGLVDWGILTSVWTGDADACRQADGACWAFLREKTMYILFGHYPFEEQWRPQMFVGSFFLLALLSQFKRFWSKALVYAWVFVALMSGLGMLGGVFGVPYVEMESWGGLPLTLSLAFLGILLSYPIGIALALGRRSELPILRMLCVVFIEVIRGVPLISLLFMSSVMLPLFLPEGVTISKVLRAQIAIIFFASAYMAEVVRGGLQSLPKGQYEAADTLGLSYFKKMIFVILPQALKAVIAPTVNTFIGLFKDTSLVFIIALSDLMFTTQASLKDTDWLGFTVEGYLFAALVYFVFCYFISFSSSRLEQELKT